MTVLLENIRAHSAASPGGVALDPISGPSVTWSELADLVAAKMADLQVEARQTPHVMRLDHGVEAAVLEIALIGAGIPVLSIPAFFTHVQAVHALCACGIQGSNALAPQSAPSRTPPGTARITFTSGSTGTPKGVCLSASHMLSVAASVVEAVGANHAGRHCALLPPGILLETVAGFFATILAGGTYVCPPQALAGLGDPFRPDFATMAMRLAEWRITSLILVPEYLAGLVAMLERSGKRLPDLTLVAVGGARVPPELLARARAVGLPVRQGYGLTECASVVSLEREGEQAPGSAGRLLGHLQASIAPDGEILLHGTMHLGHIGEPRAPGPLATGDIGRIDEQGRLWIEGRKSAMIVTSFGRNISPEWVEAALLAQPAIAQAMVHGDGLPAPEVLLVPASADADIAAAVAAANETLPAYARIAAWREVAPFNNSEVNRFLEITGMKADAPEWVARRIVAAIAERRATVSIGTLERIYAAINAIAPGIIDAGLAGQIRKARVEFC